MKKNLLNLWIVISILISILFSSFSPVFAATVTSVKEKQLLIDLDGDDVALDEEFFVLNPATNKKTAIIRIKKIKKNKALAIINTGSAQPGFTLMAKVSSIENKGSELHNETSEKTSNKNSSSNSNYLHNLKPSYGIAGKYLYNSMAAFVENKSVTPKLTDTVQLTGSSFGVGGFYEYVATPEIALQTSSYLEQFKYSGTSKIPGCSSGTSTDCSVDITYLSFYGLGQYYFTKNKFRYWLGLGGGFLMAISKSATAIKESSISSNQVGILALGADIQLSRKNYIPLSLEYVFFPGSSTVTANSLTLKAGWAWNSN